MLHESHHFESRPVCLFTRETWQLEPAFDIGGKWNAKENVFFLLCGGFETWRLITSITIHRYWQFLLRSSLDIQHYMHSSAAECRRSIAGPLRASDNAEVSFFITGSSHIWGNLWKLLRNVGICTSSLRPICTDHLSLPVPLSHNSHRPIVLMVFWNIAMWSARVDGSVLAASVCKDTWWIMQHRPKNYLVWSCDLMLRVN